MKTVFGLVTLAIVVSLGLLTGVAQASPTGDSLVMPVSGARLTQAFGCTAFASEPVDIHCPGGHFHSGIDLAAALGTPVIAALGGSVAVLHSSGGYGLHVIVDAGDGLTTLYGHLSAVLVISGDTVNTGQVIGLVGSTGNSTGPHLHFEIRRDGVPFDPLTELIPASATATPSQEAHP